MTLSADFVGIPPQTLSGDMSNGSDPVQVPPRNGNISDGHAEYPVQLFPVLIVTAFVYMGTSISVMIRRPEYCPKCHLQFTIPELVTRSPGQAFLS